METSEENKDKEKKSTAFEKKSISLRIALIAITAALYTALGYIFQPISFLGIQFRVAELIVGMCILFPIEGLIGNVIGVFFLNLSSPLGLIDLLSCIVNIPALYCIVFFRKKAKMKYLGGFLYAIIISLYVAWIIWFVLSIPFLLLFVQVLFSEIILACLGIFLFDNVGKKMKLNE